MNDRSPPVTFEPDYGTVVTRILPGIVAMMSLCGGFFLWAYLSRPAPTSLWMTLASFGVGGGFLGLYLWFLIYREVVFGEDGVTVRRYLFPDVRGPYERVTGVSSTGFRLDGFPVTWHTMENADEANAIVEELVDAGLISVDPEGGVTRDFVENRSAVIKATMLGVAAWLAAQGLGLIPDSIPSGLAALGVILAVMTVGAPLIKRMSTE